MTVTGPDTAARKSLPLSTRDLADLKLMRSSAIHRDALARLSREAVTDESSEARVLHAIVAAGLAAVREEVEAAGYAEIAAEQDLAARKAAARRRPPSWADA